MKITKWRLAAVGAVALSAVLAVTPAHASTTVTGSPSGNWSGYYADTTTPIVDADVEFTVPTVSCKDSRGTPESGGKAAYQGVMWVGIGGVTAYGINSGWLKQAGVNVSCSSLNATAMYHPFWEFVGPGGDTNPDFGQRSFGSSNPRVYPGDLIQADVRSPDASPYKGQWYFEVDVYSHNDARFIASYSAHTSLPADSVTKTYTAEAITEKNASGLVDMGVVTYAYADYWTDGFESEYSIASHPVYIRESNEVVMYPGTPSKSVVGAEAAYYSLDDSFSTYYAYDWLGAS